jgi:AcrR family transcriptional regulator
MYTVRTLSVERPPQPVATSRAAIVEAAVELADAEGLEAVSMRRLAEKLGVGTMTPYTYVASKDELLELMRDEVARAMLVPEPLPSEWREGLRQIALHTREAFEAHPWTAEARPRHGVVRLNLARHIEQSANVVAALGVEPRIGTMALAAVDDYVFGYCLRQRRRQRKRRDRRAAAAAAAAEPPTAEPQESAPPLDPEVEAAIAAGELPRFAHLFSGEAERRRLAPPEPDFEQGLDWLLDGIGQEINPIGSPDADPRSSLPLP